MPLELRKGKEYYNYRENNMKRYNSGRTAIISAIKNINPRRLFLPHYICRSIEEAIKTNGIDVELIYYYLDQSMKPQNICLTDDDCILVVNYFGLMGDEIKTLVKEFSPNSIIIDNTQAFFAEPIMIEDVYNVYSCRKFIGVSDGAYLISKSIIYDCFDDVAFSSQNAEHLLLSHEYGTNFSYRINKENENIITDTFSKMSLLTRRILESADYDYIRKKRIENFNYLHDRLNYINLYKIKMADNENIPYVYPFMADKDIRSLLISKKVYTPVLWNELLSEEYNGTFENRLADKMVFLPVDQRYNIEDMEEILELLEECMIEVD